MHPLTIILPITFSSLPNLSSTLASFSSNGSNISNARYILVTEGELIHNAYGLNAEIIPVVEVNVASILQAAAAASSNSNSVTEYTLITDSQGLLDLPSSQREQFLTEPQSNGCSASFPILVPTSVLNQTPLTTLQDIASCLPCTTFSTLFDSVEDLRTFSPVVCSLQKQGVRVVNHLGDEDTGTIDSECGKLDFLPSSQLEPSQLLFTTRPHSENERVIRIPTKEIPYTRWMTSLSSSHFMDWHIPHLTITILTNNRPASLRRLLDSLEDALYFGDKEQVTLRINLEQTADEETHRLVHEYANRFKIQWRAIIINKRIIHAGLLTAVVESWYPNHPYDDYGVILEDDVQVSRLWYVWAKVQILRLRYGDAHGANPHVFGVSLYAQKSNELIPSGRQPFYPPASSSSYMSSVPCSWGAIYFPAHWMAFHEYLTIRFSEQRKGDGFSEPLTLSRIVVQPEGIRSNRWTKSWKKFFIEMVYLRGWVMVYPNLPSIGSSLPPYASFSNNHVEPGAHVKIKSREKQEAFGVPLVSLEHERALSLPVDEGVPVLDLLAQQTSLDGLQEVGWRRGVELGLVEDRGWVF